MPNVLCTNVCVQTNVHQCANNRNKLGEYLMCDIKVGLTLLLFWLDCNEIQVQSISYWWDGNQQDCINEMFMTNCHHPLTTSYQVSYGLYYNQPPIFLRHRSPDRRVSVSRGEVLGSLQVPFCRFAPAHSNLSLFVLSILFFHILICSLIFFYL